MSLQIILKNSSVSGKEPTASQLANGELALNYHADGPFISCKDTAGVVRRIAGVWISTTAPTSPQPGEFWLDTNTDPAKLKVYKDTTDTWIETITVVAASTTAAGIVELATNTETQTGTDTLRAVTPASLQSKVSDSTSTTSSTTIASSTAVKSAKDVADAALPAAGGTISGNLIVSGDLTVNGTTTTIDTETLEVKDKNIEMGVVATPTDTTADGGGITLKGATDKTINWIDSTDSWTSSENLDLASGKTYKIAGTDVLSATALGSAVQISSNNIPAGTVTNDDLAGSIADSKLNTISTAGKVSNSATTATDANTANAIVARDASGNFSAGTITANLSGNASTVTTNANLTGDVTSVGNTTSIAAGVIVNADVNASAAIAGTKIDADFGAQDLTVDTDLLHVDATNNRVGIGTASPQSELTVRGSTPQITFEPTDDAQDCRVQFALTDGTVQSTIRGGGSLGTAITFNDGPTFAERMRIDSSGRLGLGTSSPDELLHIEGDTAEFKGTNTNTISDTGGTEQIFKFGIEGQRSGVYGPAGSIIFRQDNTSWSNITPAQKPTRIEFCTQDATATDQSETPRLVIDQLGNVGIGTASPGSLLEVSSSGSSDETIADFGNSVISGGLQIQTNGNLDWGFNARNSRNLTFSTNQLERARIDSSGRVGIGTTSPSVNLQIQDDSSFSLVRLVGSSSSVAGIDFGDAADTDTGGVRYDNVTDSMTFRVNASERARLDASGRLLVGTSSQSGGSLLQVNDDRIRIASSKTPASASDTGTAGEICWDSSYIYVCTATDTWKRAALSTW